MCVCVSTLKSEPSIATVKKRAKYREGLARILDPDTGVERDEASAAEALTTTAAEADRMELQASW